MDTLNFYSIVAKKKSQISSSESSKISTNYMEVLLDQLKGERHQQGSTKIVYYNTWKNFNQFVIRLDSIPATWERRASLYCAYLIMDKGLKPSTVRSYLSGIKAVLQQDGYEWEDNKVLLDALTRSCKIKNNSVKMRLPIQKGLLEIILFDIRRGYGDQPYLEAMYISAFLVAYYGLLRVGEITMSPHVIKAVDIHESKSKKKLLIVLHSSKTHSKGSTPQQVRIFGREQLEVVINKEVFRFAKKYERHVKPNHFCPFEWTRKYFSMRQKIKQDDEQVFLFSDGSPLQAQHLRSLLRRVLKNLQLEPSFYDIHSFRIGRATDLFKAGVDLDQIKDLGRWKSNAVYKYLRH